MRPLPSPPTAVAKNQSLLCPTAAAATTLACGPDHDTCKWKPYSNSSDDFEANAVLILIVIFCALICALALNTAIRCFLRDNNNYDQQRRPASPSPQTQHHQQRNNKPSAEVAAAPTLVVYSAGMKLTGAEVECVICLSEFVEDDVIQVLEKCKHGFHLQCIQKWLYSHYSCPICRCNCLFSPTSTPTPPQQPHWWLTTNPQFDTYTSSNSEDNLAPKLCAFNFYFNVISLYLNLDKL